MGQFLAETKAQKCSFSHAGVSEDCLAYYLSTHSVRAQSLHGEHIQWLFHYLHAKSKIRISVICFSGQLLGCIINNDGQEHLSDLKNFMYVMYGNLN